MSKEATNIKVDSKLKALFESTKPLHNFTIGDACERGIRLILTELKQKNLIMQEISQTDLEISALLAKNEILKKALEEMNNIPVAVIQSNSKDGNHNEELEKHRESRFELKKESTIRLWKKGGLNWERITIAYKFNDIAEAKEWFRNKIEGII